MTWHPSTSSQRCILATEGTNTGCGIGVGFGVGNGCGCGIGIGTMVGVVWGGQVELVGQI